MTIGDTFTIKVLKEELTYEVDQILTVLPDEMDALNVVPGEDLCTLITCTPYGINSHRLLVRGHRIETPADIKSRLVPGDVLRVNAAVVAVFLGAPVLVALFILMLVKSPKQKPKKAKTTNEPKQTKEGKR
jgi:sortase A